MEQESNVNMLCMNVPCMSVFNVPWYITIKYGYCCARCVPVGFIFYILHAMYECTTMYYLFINQRFEETLDLRVSYCACGTDQTFVVYLYTTT